MVRNGHRLWKDGIPFELEPDTADKNANAKPEARSGQLAFDDEVGVGRDFKVVGLALHEFGGFFAEVTGEEEFVEAVGQHGVRLSGGCFQSCNSESLCQKFRRR